MGQERSPPPGVIAALAPPRTPTDVSQQHGQGQGVPVHPPLPHPVPADAAEGRGAAPGGGPGGPAPVAAVRRGGGAGRQRGRCGVASSVWAEGRFVTKTSFKLQALFA